MDLWSRLDDVHARWNVLEHPFYERWSDGGLTRDDLARYAGQYRHAVVALAQAADRAARVADADEVELAVHAGEEAAHVALWDAFAVAAGTDGPQPAEPETVACAAAWAGDGRDLLGHLVALYAIENAQPAISRVKADGLREHYGFAAGPGTAYFDLHAELDREHAAEGRELIAARIEEADEDALVAEAERVLKANWGLLDGVERLCAR
ncbi:MAG TPA: iron-containing redox enzyme family protein [Solirubrobacteraceae bacterium]|nr:iron-containing redox enzyme family protein [Solirubrobacteraceae bacterium]